ncbi:forkhead box protein N3-like, partial [Limulus polyphemus]|uniref:Forkhead box protein N3 n=1 Tax=Limulus polyphemus TaxID=6850 RepID=A0ABM1C0Q4_LIMPO
MAITESLMKEGKIFVTMATEQSFEVYSQKCVSPPLRFNIANGTASIIEMSNGHGKTNGNSSVSEKGGFEDDELTNLTWLQDTNLLKNIQMGSCGEAEVILNDNQADDLFEDAADDGSDKTESPFSSKSTLTEPYNPQVHVNAKPPYSFSCLIFMAIEDSPVKALAVKDIYSWILTHFPYFQNAPTGWKNSVRHNLSLNKCFSKVDKIKGQNIGKGSLWCIDSQFRPNLLQALRKSPSSTFSHMPSLDYILRFSQPKANNTCDKPLPLVPTLSNINLPSP